jgi:hypothetical protein
VLKPGQLVFTPYRRTRGRTSWRYQPLWELKRSCCSPHFVGMSLISPVAGRSLPQMPAARQL